MLRSINNHHLNKLCQCSECCIPSFKVIGRLVPKKVCKGFYQIWALQPCWLCALNLIFSNEIQSSRRLLIKCLSLVKLLNYAWNFRIFLPDRRKFYLTCPVGYVSWRQNLAQKLPPITYVKQKLTGVTATVSLSSVSPRGLIWLSQILYVSQPLYGPESS